MIFEIFDLLILGSGLFPVFTEMGSGSQSGKLKFRSIINGDSSITLTDGPNGITISSNVVSTPISLPLREIAYGTGAGITSNLFCVDTRTNYTAITGAPIFSSYCSKVYQPSNSNLIVTGCYNCITSYGKSNIIIGGCNSIIGGCSSPYSLTNDINNYNSSIITSKCSKVSSNASTIVGTRCSSLGLNTNNSTIISGIKNDMRACATSGYHNIIVGGIYNKLISNPGSISPAYNNLIFSSMCSCFGFYYYKSPKINFCNAYNTRHNGIVSGFRNRISHYNVNGNLTENNLLLSGRSNSIKGGSVTPYATYGTENSLIISGSNNLLNDTCNSSILGGSYNYICKYRNSNENIPETDNSTIIGGYRSLISSSGSGKNKGSSIISSKCATIFNSSYSSIISTDCFPYIANPSIEYSYSSVILSGGGNQIQSSCNTNILGGNFNKSLGALDSSIVGGRYNNMGGTIRSSAIISSNTSTICGYICSSTIISGCENCIRTSNGSIVCNSSIVGGSSNLIDVTNGSGRNNEDSVIIGGCYNRMIGRSKRNVILSGIYNIICDRSYNSSIMGGRYQCMNPDVVNSVMISSNLSCMGEVDNSVILGGYLNCISPGVCNSVIIAGCQLCLSYSNTLMVPNFRFRDRIRPTSGSQYGRTGTFSNNLLGSFIVRNGFVTTT